MALKLPDSAVPMGDFPVAKAVDIDFDDGENLQEKLDNGKLGGGGGAGEVILDTEVRIDKTHSSSKIYADIQQCLQDSKDFTLEELGTEELNTTAQTVNGAINELLAVYNSSLGKTNGIALVGTPQDIGITFPCTTVQLTQAMRNKFSDTSGAIGIFNCAGKTATITDAPFDYGLLHIEVIGFDRLSIRFGGMSQSTYVGSWIGQIKGSGGIFSDITWSRFDNESRVTALETKNTTIENRLTTLEQNANDLFQSVSDGKTLVANAITDKGVSTSTDATFATMASNIRNISGATVGYKSESKSGSVDVRNGVTAIISITFSNTVLGVTEVKWNTNESRLSYKGFSISGNTVTVTIETSSTITSYFTVTTSVTANILA